MRVHDEVAHLARTLIEVDAEECEGELAAADHHGRALCLEVVQQLARAAGDGLARLVELVFARHTQCVVEVV